MIRRRLRTVSAAVALTAAIIGAAAPAHASDWTVIEEVGDTGISTRAEAMAMSGDARLAVGCTGSGLLYVSLEYLGYESGAPALTVGYRVDSRNAIVTRWPREDAFDALMLYNSNRTFVQELARRVARGRWLSVTVEVLPELRFSLSGSESPVTTVTALCSRGESPNEEENQPAGEDSEAVSDEGTDTSE